MSDDNAPKPREALAAPTSYQPVPSNQLFPKWERNLKFALIAAAGVVGVAGFRYWKAQQPPPVVPVVHFSRASQWTSGDGITMAPAFARSGNLAAYASDRDGPGSLAIWTQPLGSGKPQRVTAGEFNESDPDFSPDDRRIVYRSDRDGGGIYVVPAAGGAPRLLAKEGWRPKFSPDGKWVAFCKLTGSEDVSSIFGSGQIFVVPSDGGEPKRIQPDFPFARYPIWTPDGKHLLFVGTRADGAKDWWVTGLDGGEAIRTHATDFLVGPVKSVGMPDQWRGQRIYFSAAEERQPHIWQLPISLSSWQVSGPPRRLTDGAASEQQSAAGPDGSVMFTSMKRTVELHSLPIEPDQAKVTGKLTPLTNLGGSTQLPSMSAGSKLAYVSDKSGMRDIWVSDLDTKTEDAVTTFRPIGYRPVISSDGKLLAYPSTIKGKCTVVVQAAAAGGRQAALPGCFAIWDWSKDSARMLTFPSSGDMSTVDLLTIRTHVKRPVLAHAKRSFYGARFSPDGQWVAFAAGLTSGQARLYIAPLRSQAVREPEWIPIGDDKSGDPAWSPDGNVLYFRSKRDGYHCIWARRLGTGKKPEGEPIPIQHFHSAAFGLYLLKATEFNITLAKDRLVLNASREQSNLWMTRPEENGE